MLHGPKETQKRAAKLRRQMTLPEVVLWQELRKRPADLKFRRQHPAGRYVLDFYCALAWLAVEVDGIAHDMGDNPERDIVRDAWLDTQGVRVIRFPAPEVLRDVHGVVEQIAAAALVRHPSTTRFAGGPPPLAGEDF
ncbi:MAG: endonuclease domain-containing protein [Novosphingobium sp.]